MRSFLPLRYRVDPLRQYFRRRRRFRRDDVGPAQFDFQLDIVQRLAVNPPPFRRVTLLSLIPAALSPHYDFVTVCAILARFLFSLSLRVRSRKGTIPFD
jgi:hypothetical protein